MPVLCLQNFFFEHRQICSEGMKKSIDFVLSHIFSNWLYHKMLTHENCNKKRSSTCPNFNFPLYENVCIIHIIIWFQIKCVIDGITYSYSSSSSLILSLQLQFSVPIVYFLFYISFSTIVVVAVVVFIVLR